MGLSSVSNMRVPWSVTMRSFLFEPLLIKALSSLIVTESEPLVASSLSFLALIRFLKITLEEEEQIDLNDRD